MSEPAWLAATSGQGKASVPNKFHDHPGHMLVRQKSQQRAGEATVTDSVKSSCQIDKHGAGLLFCLKRILDVLRKLNDLVHSRLFRVEIQPVPLEARGRLLVRHDFKSVV